MMMARDEVMMRAIPNTSFQQTLTRGGCGPLNSDRWHGAARRANATGVDERLWPAHSAGQQVVRRESALRADSASLRPRHESCSLRGIFRCQGSPQLPSR